MINLLSISNLTILVTPASVAIQIDIAGEVLKKEDDTHSSEDGGDNQRQEDYPNVF